MFILASSSPRRQALLGRLVAKFSIIEPRIDEGAVRAPVSALPQEIARMKAYAVHKNHLGDTVLACDTIVYFKGRRLGKPRDKLEATDMLRLLAGTTHKVITGYTLVSPNFEITRTVVTRVTFAQISDEAIARYIAGGSPFDKAGGYGIQDDDFPYVEKIEGSYFNVMGLPLEDLQAVFAKFNVTV